MLEYHQESTPKNPAIRKRFHTCHFADHEERVVDPLARVTPVSVETVRILAELPGEPV